MQEVPNRVAIVTGGSRGIGRAVVEALADDDWRVVFCSRSRDSVQQALDELTHRFGDAVRGRAVDVRDQDAVDRFVASTLETEGRIDCLVNNAGLGIFGPVDEISGDQWRTLIETNLNGAFYFLRAVAPMMRERGDGWIFNIASIAGRHTFAGGAAYNASKFGMVALSDAAMLDLRKDGIRVSAILPGSVATEFGSGDGTAEWKLVPEDVSRAVMDLLRYPARALPSRLELRPTQTKS